MSSAKTTRQSGVSTNAVVQPIPKKSLQIRTDKPRPHLCTICTRGFARLEHLKRHERAHTNEKPYQCAACGRCFARRDLVLRHQQKLHQNIFTVARRGSLPASLTEPDEVDVAHTSPNENVIILRNNTSAKAPLPDQPNMFKNSGLGSRGLESGGSDSASSSPSTASPRTVSAHQGPHNIDSIISTGQNYANKPIQVNGVIPSPDTTSHHNTPPVPGAMLKTGPSFSDLDMLSSHNNYLADYTQQPSPSMGDSPSDILEKQRLLKEKQRQDFLNDQLDFKSSLDLKSLNGFQSRPPNPRTRHSSFSAIPGLSYTNLQDALTIRNTQSGSKQNFNSHGIPQFNDADIGYVPYLFDTDVDWYNMNLENSTRVVPNGPTGELLPSKDAGSKPEKNEFKMNHPLIPTEPQFSGAFMENESPSHIITGHQFQNPEHPHHIRGTTPLDFEFSAYKEPLHHGELPEIQFGSGYAQLTQDIALLQEHEARKKLGSHENQVHESQVHAGPEIFARREAATSNTPPKTNESMLQDPKRRKIGFVNDIDDLTWLEEFKDIPVPNELPIASKDTGFVGMPFVKDEFKSDEVFSLFKLKQDDLVKQRSQLDLNSLKRTHMAQSNSSGAASRPGHAWSKTSRAHFTIGEPNDFITDELRARVIETSHVVEEHFPSKEDLNEYMDLYGEEFNTYFSFIHLETLKDPMVDNFENIPMILAMCAIGALYSYHDSNTLLLFNLSKYHIHKFFENEVTPNKLQSKKVPIMAHQCLVLHIFISMFLNEPNMVEITSKQVYSMVGLIRSTNFFRPLEQFLLPPPPVTNPNDQENLQNNYGYFIMAQTRIRTLLTFYQLEVIRSILIGGPLPMTGAELKSGIHCKDESLWQAGNSGEWFARVSKHKDWCIVDLSNNKSLQELAETLKGAQMTDEKSSFDKSMALLMYVHEQISDSYISGFDAFTWRSECRPKLKYLILSWEEYFVRNGGSVIINNQNQTMLTKNTELKVILPLLWLAKIRLCVNFVPVTFALLSRDWLGMSESLVKLEDDVDGLRDASIHALDILKLWIHNTSVVNDAKQTSVRTPVFFLTAVFISVMVLGKTIDVIENGKSLSVSEKALWQSCEKVFRSIETTLSAHEQSSYSEFLNKQSGGVFNFAQSNAFHNNVAALNLGDPAIKVRQLKKCKLSTRVLALGVRILADAPLWPLAMRFAEAFKHMAVEIENRG